MKDQSIGFTKFKGKSYEVTTNYGKFLVSYETPVVRITENGYVILDENYWDYSRTTSLHVSSYLGITKKEILSKLKSGEYIMGNLQ